MPIDCLGLVCAFILTVISVDSTLLVFTEKPAVNLIALIIRRFSTVDDEKTEIPNFDFAFHLLVKFIFVPEVDNEVTISHDSLLLDPYLLTTLASYTGSVCSLEIIACVEVLEAKIKKMKKDLTWLKSDSVFRAVTWGIKALAKLEKSQLSNDGDKNAIEMAHSVLECAGDLTSWIGEDSGAVRKAGKLWLPVVSELLKHLDSIDPSAQRRTKGVQTTKPKTPYALKRDFVRLVGNLAFRCKENQNAIREAGLLGPILNSSVLDDNNPYIQQWSVLAIRNLTEDNPKNQKEVERIAPEKTLKHQKQAMQELMRASSKDDVKVRGSEDPSETAELIEELKRSGVNVSTVEM